MNLEAIYFEIADIFNLRKTDLDEWVKKNSEFLLLKTRDLASEYEKEMIAYYTGIAEGKKMDLDPPNYLKFIISKAMDPNFNWNSNDSYF